MLLTFFYCLTPLMKHNLAHNKCAFNEAYTWHIIKVNKYLLN